MCGDKRYVYRAENPTQSRPTMAGNIAIFGGWKRWGELGAIDQGLKGDALWRSTARKIWELALPDGFERVSAMIPGAPQDIEPAVPSNYSIGGVQEAGGSDEDNPFGETCNALDAMYAEYRPEQGRYRTGGRQLAPDVTLAQTTSWKEHWSEAN